MTVTRQNHKLTHSFPSSNGSRAAPSMSTSTKTGSSQTSNGTDGTAEPRHGRARVAEWQRQPRSEDTWSFGQSGKERNKALLANLDNIMSRIDPRDMAAATGSANH